MNKNIYIVIPAKNEGTRIGAVLKYIQKEGYDNVVVVNDGSTDNTVSIAKKWGATVLTHYVSLGAGAATQTGIEYAMKRGADVVVTLDGDNQHCPTDIKFLIKRMTEKNVDIVIGSRFLNKDNDIPFVRVIYNKIGNVITGFLTGLFVTDSQSGFKAMRAKFAKESKINLNGYEFCTEIISMIKRQKASYAEVPIKVRYTKDTQAKGQSFFNGVRMVGTLVRHFL